MFAGQASFIVLAPILPDVAREFGVSTAEAGQIRLAAGVAGGAAALGLAPLARRLGLRHLLGLGLALIAAGALASALAPSFGALAGAQLAIGSGLGIVVSTAVAGAREWVRGERRAQALSWALLGQPAAWVVGMPIAGIVGAVNWRLAWLAVPLLASVGAWAAVRGQPAGPPAAAPQIEWRAVWTQPRIVGWAAGELFAFAAWGGTLVFSGSLFIETYGASPDAVGVVLAVGALGYFPGNLLARRHLDRAASLQRGFGLALAGGLAAFGFVRPGPLASAAVFAGLVFLAGARTLAASAVGLDAAPAHAMAISSIRAAVTQFGYLLGVAVAGAALAGGGYAAFGLAQAALMVGAVTTPLIGAAAIRLVAAAPAGSAPGG